MAIVKKLVDAMGGTIDIQSELEKGTKVAFTLEHRLATPDEIEAEKNADKNSTVQSIDFSGKKVLLVEDNELNREIAVEILDEEGFITDIAEDGTIAVQSLKEKGPDFYDFILMDIQMPIMNGYEATKAIRAMYPDSNIPIIAVSANAFEEDKKASIEAGMNDHVSKPIVIKELFEALEKFM
jgi:FOG: CheY-like receiver